MAEQRKNPRGPGAFCWYELAVNDPQAAKRFYRELFGWEAKDMPMPGGGPIGTYTIWELNGKGLGGMYQLSGEMRGRNVPPHWSSYVEVENIDRSFEKAKRLGATGLTPIMTVGDMGRSVMIKDPTGAVLALWQNAPGGGSGQLQEQVHGNRCWNEMLTHDVDRAGKFYTDLFGWRPQPMSTPQGSYTVFLRGDEQIGGLMGIQEEWGQMPSNWVVYFAVNNCDKAVEIVKRHMGQQLGDILDITNVGRVAMVMDPQKAYLGFVQPPQ